MRSKLQDDWDWAPFPQFRGKKRVAMGQASPLIMGTSSKSKDAAWELMKFLGGPIGQERAMTIGISQPILKAQHNSPIFSGQKPPHTPQVALDDAPEPGGELRRPRLVEVEALAQFFYLLRRGVLPQQRRRDVARHRPDDEEDDDADHQHGGQHRREST